MLNYVKDCAVLKETKYQTQSFFNNTTNISKLTMDRNHGCHLRGVGVIFKWNSLLGNSLLERGQKRDNVILSKDGQLGNEYQAFSYHSESMVTMATISKSMATISN